MPFACAAKNILFPSGTSILVRSDDEPTSAWAWARPVNEPAVVAPTTMAAASRRRMWMLYFMSVPPKGCQTDVAARRFLTTSVCYRGGERRREPYGSNLPRTFRQISRRGRSVLCRPRGEEALQCLAKLLQSALAE